MRQHALTVAFVVAGVAWGTSLLGDDLLPIAPAAPASLGLHRMVAPVGPRVDGGENEPKIRQREGAKLTDRRGRFERRGERYVFLSDEPVAHFLVLENLMLERVANVLADAAGGQLRWSVSGTITEYRGSNYLLLDRAVVKSTREADAPPPSTEPAKTAARR